MISKKYLKVYLLDATLEFDAEYIYLPLPNEQHYIGQLVEVPFGRGNSLRRAIITDQTDHSEFKNVKEIAKIIIKSPIYLSDQISLAKEMKRRYFCSVGQALKTISPPTVFEVGKKTARACKLIDPQEAKDLLAGEGFTSLQQQRVVEMLLQVDSALAQEITQACQVSDSVLKTLERKNILEIFTEKVEREVENNLVWSEPEVEHLNLEQEKAIQGILQLAKQKPVSSNKSSSDSEQEYLLRESLLFGITGSGKTEVYLRIAQDIINQRRTVIILVPEISLTPLMISRFTNKFADKIAVLHSRLTVTQRFEQWQKILNQEKQIVVGARSAIFAPLKNIGLIVIDEEQETSYRSETTPRYVAHDIARIRAIEHDSLLILGSATPSVETFHRTEIGKSRLFKLTQRAKQAPLPKVHFCAMNQEHARPDFDGVFSRKLLTNLQNTFDKGGQAMLFINRRGFAAILQCNSCGYVVKCPNCEVAMTRHTNQHNRRAKRLICHYCGLIKPVMTTCPVCQSEQMDSSGLGTQMVEDAFYKHFPDYRALRMDFDTTVGLNAHQEILTAFGEGEADCLIGTQMIAKGHDFPNVQTVGILAVDSLLNTGTYKSEERAFQLLTQAAGRSGRSDIQGNVFLQGYGLDNHVIKSAAEQDYLKFYKAQLEFRKRAEFPPFGQIGIIMIQGLVERTVRNEATNLFISLQKAMQNDVEYFKGVTLYTPAPAPIARLRKRYRYRLIIKSPKVLQIAQMFYFISRRKKPSGVGISLDINPEHML